MNRPLRYGLLAALIWLIPRVSPAIPDPSAGGSYAYPNPASDCCVHIVYRMAEAGSAEVLVYQEAGDIAATANDPQDAGLRQSTIPLCRLGPGCYFYRVKIQYRSGKVVTLPMGHFGVTKR